MTFFTTPELLELGNLPFVSPYGKPRARKPCSTTAAWPTPTGSRVIGERVESIGREKDTWR